jgi:hypothetical protein
MPLKTGYAGRTGVFALHATWVGGAGARLRGWVRGFRPVGLGTEGETGGRLSNGEDEIGVVGNDVDDDEIYFGGLVGDNVSAGVAGRADVVEAVDQAGGGFYLDTPELFAFGPAAADEDEVETFTVAVGPGDSEALASGFMGEGQFGELSAAFGVEFLLAGSLRAGRWGASGRRAGF